MNIDDSVLRSFKMGRIFKHHPLEKDLDPTINSISFHRTQDLLVTASNDDAIRVYDTMRGVEQERGPTLSKKYGVANICFTHDPSSVIYSSSKGGSHAWRYHDLHANRYHRYFEGHTGPVTTLCLSPKTDQVLSAGEDKQVRLWDLKSGWCTAMLHAPGLPTVAWDEQGIVFCVGTESGVVKLYDARNYAQGPFKTFEVDKERNSNAAFAVIRFSLDGKRLLGVVEGRIYVLDAYEGNLIQSVSTGVPEGGAALEACLTADGQYIISGCGDRHIRSWSVATGEVVAQWEQHPATPTCLKFSPRKMLVASACRTLALWVPDPALASVQAAQVAAQRQGGGGGGGGQVQQQQQQQHYRLP